MYAIVKSGGKQQKVAVGQTFRVESLSQNGERLAEGTKVVLDQVLMLADGDKITIGAPLVAGATVACEVVEQTRDAKIVVFKKRRRQNYRRKLGHKQHITVLKVTAISAK